MTKISGIASAVGIHTKLPTVFLRTNPNISEHFICLRFYLNKQKFPFYNP